MELRISLFSLLFLLAFPVKAQKLQLGFELGGIKTFFLNTSSSYNTSLYSARGNYSLGLGISISAKIDSLWSVRSGVRLQNKGYDFRQTGFQSPYVEGENSLAPEIIALEAPLAIRRQISTFRHGNNIGVVFGSVFSWNELFEYSFYYNLRPAGNNLPATDTISYHLSNSMDFRTIFSPEILLGLDYNIRKGGFLRHVFVLSFQYGFNKMHGLNSESRISINKSAPVITKAYLEPRLSYLSVRYIYYPQWMAFFKRPA
jgi:hypothetical protein